MKKGRKEGIEERKGRKEGRFGWGVTKWHVTRKDLINISLIEQN